MSKLSHFFDTFLGYVETVDISIRPIDDEARFPGRWYNRSNRSPLCRNRTTLQPSRSSTPTRPPGFGCSACRESSGACASYNVVPRRKNSLPVIPTEDLPVAVAMNKRQYARLVLYGLIGMGLGCWYISRRDWAMDASSIHAMHYVLKVGGQDIRTYEMAHHGYLPPTVDLIGIRDRLQSEIGVRLVICPHATSAVGGTPKPLIITNKLAMPTNAFHDDSVRWVILDDGSVSLIKAGGEASSFSYAAQPLARR